MSNHIKSKPKNYKGRFTKTKRNGVEEYQVSDRNVVETIKFLEFTHQLNLMKHTPLSESQIEQQVNKLRKNTMVFYIQFGKKGLQTLKEGYFKQSIEESEKRGIQFEIPNYQYQNKKGEWVKIEP